AVRPAAHLQHYAVEAGYPGGITAAQRLAGFGIPFRSVELYIPRPVDEIGQYGDPLVEQSGAVQIILGTTTNHALQPAGTVATQAEQGNQADQCKAQQLHREAIDNAEQGQQAHRQRTDAKERGDQPGHEELGNQQRQPQQQPEGISIEKTAQHDLSPTLHPNHEMQP